MRIPISCSFVLLYVGNFGLIYRQWSQQFLSHSAAHRNHPLHFTNDCHFMYHPRHPNLSRYLPLLIYTCTFSTSCFYDYHFTYHRRTGLLNRSWRVDPEDLHASFSDMDIAWCSDMLHSYMGWVKALSTVLTSLIEGPEKVRCEYRNLIHA